MDLVGVWVVAGKVRGFVAAHLVCFGVRGRQQAVSVAVLACQPLAACRRRSAELPGRGQALVSLALHGQKRQASGRRLWVCDGSEERDCDRPSWLGLWESHRLEAEFCCSGKVVCFERSRSKRGLPLGISARKRVLRKLPRARIAGSKRLKHAGRHDRHDDDDDDTTGRRRRARADGAGAGPRVGGAAG